MDKHHASADAGNAVMRAYRVAGTTDEVTTCGNCGRDDLKSTVVLEVLDPGGSHEGFIYAGCDCAAHLAKRTQKQIRSQARAASKAAAQALEAAVSEAAAETSRARDTALAAWVTATYGVPASTRGPWPQFGDVPGVSPYQLVKAWEAAGKPGLPAELDVHLAGVRNARLHARHLPPGVSLATATPHQIIAAIRAGQAQPSSNKPGPDSGAHKEKNMATTRRPDHKAETPADTRFFGLRESGYLGPVDQDGRKVTGDRATDPVTGQTYSTYSAHPGLMPLHDDWRHTMGRRYAAPMRCPECGEPAVHRPPTDLVPWQAHGRQRPAWSHADGSSLCPVTGPGGYQPATPVPASSSPASPAPGQAGPAAGQDLPASDTQFLESAAQLAGVLHGLAADVTSWAEDLATLNLPQPVLSPLHAAATAITGAAGHASEAASAFREAFSGARQAAAGGLAITGENPA